jgi:replication factor A1
MKINELRDGARRVNVEGRVTEKSETRDVRSRRTGEQLQVATAVIRDDTGAIGLTLWNEQIDEVNVGDTVQIENGYVSSFRGELQLNVGRYGNLTIKRENL